MARIRIGLRERAGLALGTAVLTSLGVLGAPAVANAQPSPPAPGGGAATAPPSEGADGHHAGMLRNLLHGEGTIQTTQGQVRVAIQKGTITSASGSSVTVRSADGWARTWTLAGDAHVYDRHQAVPPSALTTGTRVMIAGTIAAGANGGTYTAHVVHVHMDGGMQSSPEQTPGPTGT